MSNALAPVAFFAFNRPRHTERTLAALAANPEAAQTALHVFVDGPRSEDERGIVKEVAALARRARGFGSIDIHEATKNQGLYAAITSGVTRVISDAGRVIVVEDDILVTSNFLAYMNEALDRYENEPKVGSIHGYSPPITGLPDYFFLRGADCWGWATWANRWPLFGIDASALLRSLVSQRLLSEFCSSHGNQSLLHLVRRAQGRNQSWAIMWHASLFLASRYTLHPGTSFVQNIGNDGSGFHSRNSAFFTSPLRMSYSGLSSIPVEQDESSARAIAAFMDGETARSRYRTLRRHLLSAYAKTSARLTIAAGA